MTTVALPPTARPPPLAPCRGAVPARRNPLVTRNRLVS